MLRWSDLNPGEVVKVCGFYPGQIAYRQKLLAMGLTPDTECEVIRRAPLGDPIEIRVRDFYLSLRQVEADLIKIERMQPR
jgi:Fe2+ transport system protein FeoA